MAAMLIWICDWYWFHAAINWAFWLVYLIFLLWLICYQFAVLVVITYIDMVDTDLVINWPFWLVQLILVLGSYWFCNQLAVLVSITLYDIDMVNIELVNNWVFWLVYLIYLLLLICQSIGRFGCYNWYWYGWYWFGNQLAVLVINWVLVYNWVFVIIMTLFLTELVFIIKKIKHCQYISKTWCFCICVINSIHPRRMAWDCFNRCTFWLGPISFDTSVFIFFMWAQLAQDHLSQNAHRYECDPFGFMSLHDFSHVEQALCSSFADWSWWMSSLLLFWFGATAPVAPSWLASLPTMSDFSFGRQFKILTCA